MIDKELECLVVESKFKKQNILVVSMYRSPNTNPSKFIDQVRKLTKISKDERKLLIIGTDQNLDLLKYTVHEPTEKLLDIMLDNGMLPSITKPTRITRHSATLIDNIYATEKLVLDSESKILTDELSDHLPCLCLYRQKVKKAKQSIEIKYRKVNVENLEKVKLDMSQVSLNEELDSSAYCESLHGTLKNSFDMHMPRKS